MWLRFLCYGLLFAGLLWSIRKSGIPRMLRFSLVAFFLVGGAIAVYLTSEQVFLSDQSWYQRTPAREILLFILMLLGMASRYMTKLIEARRKKIADMKDDSREKPGLDFDIWDFSYPLFVSVITFGLLLQQVGDESLSLSNGIMSFQTGFFWQTLLSKTER